MTRLSLIGDRVAHGGDTYTVGDFRVFVALLLPRACSAVTTVPKTSVLAVTVDFVHHPAAELHGGLGSAHWWGPFQTSFELRGSPRSGSKGALEIGTLRRPRGNAHRIAPRGWR